jgi:lipoprotein-anchoring transpeptidase ErfK/SrfK
MHAGRISGYPASHGCIRLPRGFAKLLYGVTKLGTPVMIRA